MDKVPEVYEGKIYKTWNTFAIEYEQFLEHYAHPIFVIENSRSVKSHNKMAAEPIPTVCGYIQVVFGCAHGPRSPNNSKGIRKRVNKLKMNCTAKLNITYTRRLDAFKILACQLDHVDENGVKVHDLNKEQFSWYRQSNWLHKNYLIPRVVRVYSEQENRLTWIVTKKKALAKECAAYADLADESDGNTVDEPRKKKPESDGITVDEPRKKKPESDGITVDEPRKKKPRISNSKDYHKIKGLPMINIFTDKSGKKHVKESRKIVIINKTSLDKSDEYEYEYDLAKILPRKVVIAPRSDLKNLKEAKTHDGKVQITPSKEATVSNKNHPVQSTPSHQINKVNAEIDKEISARGMKCTNVKVTSLRKPYNIVTVNKNLLPIIEKVTEEKMNAIINKNVNNKPVCDGQPMYSDVGGTKSVLLDCTELETESISSEEEGETMLEQLEQDIIELTDPLKFEFAETLTPANLNVAGTLTPGNLNVAETLTPANLNIAETLENPEFPETSSSPNCTKTKKLLCVEKLKNLNVPKEFANEVAKKLSKKHAQKLTNPKVAENPTHINITEPKKSFVRNPSIPKVVEKPANPRVAEKAGIRAMPMCRGCLSTLPPLRPLDGELAQLYKKFIDNNPVCDVFPKLLCGNCSDILIQFTAFRDRCFSAQRQFYKTYVAGIELTPNDAVKSQMKQNFHRFKPATPKESMSPDRQIMVKTSMVEKYPNYAEKSKMKRSPHEESISSNRQIVLEISSNDAGKSKANQDSYPDIRVIPSEESNRQLMPEILPIGEKRPSPEKTVSSNDAVTSKRNQNSDIIVELEDLIVPKPAQNVQNLSSKTTSVKLKEHDVNEIRQVINKKAESLSSGKMIRYSTAGGRKIVEIRKTNNVRHVTVKSFEKGAVFSTEAIVIDDGPKSKVSNIIDDSSIIIDDSSISSLEDTSEMNFTTSSIKDGADDGAKSKVSNTNYDDTDDGSSSSSLEDASEMIFSTRSIKDGGDDSAKSKVSNIIHEDSSISSIEDASTSSIKDGGNNDAKSQVSNIIHDDSSISSLEDASTSSIKDGGNNDSKSQVSNIIHDDSSISSIEDASTSSIKDGRNNDAKSQVSNIIHDDSSISSIEDASTSSIKDGGNNDSKSQVSNIIHDDSSISSIEDA